MRFFSKKRGVHKKIKKIGGLKPQKNEKNFLDTLPEKIFGSPQKKLHKNITEGEGCINVCMKEITLCNQYIIYIIYIYYIYII